MIGSLIRRVAASVSARRGTVRPEREMDEEMRFHLEMAARRHVERGLAPDEARRRALATFGGVAQHQEAARDNVPGNWLDELRQDLRYAIRTLQRNPGFTTSVVLTLALGVGANTAIFSVVNGVLLRPLPVRDPSQLTYIGWTFGTPDNWAGSLSTLKLDFLRRHATSLAGLTTFQTSERDLGTGPNARSIHGLRVSDDFFTVIGASPVLGRGFVAEEQRAGGPSAVVLSDALWRAAFGANRNVIGTQVRLNDSAYTVVGVTGREFRVPGEPADQVEFVVPLQLVINPSERSNNYEALARIRSERTREQARADLDAVSKAFSTEHPDHAAPNERYRLMAFEDLYVGPTVKRTLYVLLGAVTFVLLISAANAANLLLARAAAREREIVVRTALGAKRSRIVRQLLSEGLVLSTIAGAAGLALSVWGVRAMLALMPRQLPRADEIGLDYRVLAFAAAIVLVTGVVFGLAAALPTGRLNLASVLGERARGSGASRRSRDLLVMSETAFAIILLAGAGLLLGSFARLRRVDPGFKAENVTAVRFGRMPNGYDTMDAIWTFERQLIDALAATPGIQRVAALPNFPLQRGWNMPVAKTGVAESGDGGVEYRLVSPSYFETLGIAIVQGRGLTLNDDRKAPRVAIINQAMAKRFFPGGGALGSQLDVGRHKDQWISDEFKGPVQIVGIAGDIREIGLDAPPKRTVYVPIAQGQDRLVDSPLLVIRAVPGLSLRNLVEEATRRIDPRVAPPRLEPMPEIVGASLAEQRFQTALISLFAGTALALTAIGIFGVVAYGVQQRVREIGVRVALGASSGDVMRLIVGRSLAFVSAGAIVGVIGALGLTRFLAGILYGVKAADPATFALAVLTLLGVAFLASYVPARRATRIDPVRALRLE
jgi:putative ABC transport system permease protein